MTRENIASTPDRKVGFIDKVRQNPRQTLAALGFAGLAALGIVGCGGDKETVDAIKKTTTTVTTRGTTSTTRPTTTSTGTSTTTRPVSTTLERPAPGDTLPARLGDKIETGYDDVTTNITEAFNDPKRALPGPVEHDQFGVTRMGKVFALSSAEGAKERHEVTIKAPTDAFDGATLTDPEAIKSIHLDGTENGKVYSVDMFKQSEGWEVEANGYRFMTSGTMMGSQYQNAASTLNILTSAFGPDPATTTTTR